jgi:dipeptidyl aminopeptidase/acylaminoacyl peptidase
VSWSPTGEHFAFTRDVAIDPPVTAAHPDLPKANARAYDDLMVRHWDHWQDGSYSHLFVQPWVGGGGGARPDAGRTRAHAAAAVRRRRADRLVAGRQGTVLHGAARAESRTEHRQQPVGGAGRRRRGEEPDAGHAGLRPGPGLLAGRPLDRVRQHGARRASRRTGCGCACTTARRAATSSCCRLRRQRARGALDQADSQRLFFTVETEGTTQVYTATLPSAKAEPVTSGRHALSGLQVAPDGRTLYALRTAMERPAEVVQIDVASGAITARTDHNGPAFADLSLPQIDGEWFDTTDGKKVHAWIVKPPGFDPKQRYPFVLYCQGGPQSMVGQGFSFRWNFHLMASKGYVVAAVNRRGLPGFGQAWNDEISKDWGGQAMRTCSPSATRCRHGPTSTRRAVLRSARRSAASPSTG